MSWVQEELMMISSQVPPSQNAGSGASSAAGSTLHRLPQSHAATANTDTGPAATAAASIVNVEDSNGDDNRAQMSAQIAYEGRVSVLNASHHSSSSAQADEHHHPGGPWSGSSPGNESNVALDSSPPSPAGLTGRFSGNFNSVSLKNLFKQAFEQGGGGDKEEDSGGTNGVRRDTTESDVVVDDDDEQQREEAASNGERFVEGEQMMGDSVHRMSGNNNVSSGSIEPASSPRPDNYGQSEAKEPSEPSSDSMTPPNDVEDGNELPANDEVKTISASTNGAADQKPLAAHEIETENVEYPQLHIAEVEEDEGQSAQHAAARAAYASLLSAEKLAAIERAGGVAYDGEDPVMGISVRQDIQGELGEDMRNITDEMGSDDEELRIDEEMEEETDVPDEQFESVERNVDQMPPFLGFQPYMPGKDGEESINSLEKLQQVLNSRMFQARSEAAGGRSGSDLDNGQAGQNRPAPTQNRAREDDGDYKFLLPPDEEGTVYQCHLCSYSATSRVPFNAHVNTHYTFQCVKCDFEEKSENIYVRHLKEEHNCTPEDLEEAEVRVPRVNSQGKVKTFKCKQCEFVAVTKIEFWKHGRGHIKPEKLLFCPKCIFVTEYKHHLEYHLRNHYGTKPFKCQHCNYSCVNKSMLNSHMKSHTNHYQYSCADCTYATKYCHSLKLHLRKYEHKPAMVVSSDGSPHPLPGANPEIYGAAVPTPGRRQKGKKNGVGAIPSMVNGAGLGGPHDDPMYPPSLLPSLGQFPNIPAANFMQLQLQHLREQMAGGQGLAKHMAAVQRDARHHGPPPPPPPPPPPLHPSHLAAHHPGPHVAAHHHHMQRQQLQHHLKLSNAANGNISPPFGNGKSDLEVMKCDKCEFSTFSKDVFRNHMMLHATADHHRAGHANGSQPANSALHQLLSSPLHNNGGTKRSFHELNESMEEYAPGYNGHHQARRGRSPATVPGTPGHNTSNASSRSPHSSPYGPRHHSSFERSESPPPQPSAYTMKGDRSRADSGNHTASSSPSSLPPHLSSYLNRFVTNNPLLLNGLVPNPAIRALIEERNRESISSFSSSLSMESERRASPESPPGASRHESRAQFLPRLSQDTAAAREAAANAAANRGERNGQRAEAPLPPNKRLRTDIFNALYANRMEAAASQGNGTDNDRQEKNRNDNNGNGTHTPPAVNDNGTATSSVRPGSNGALDLSKETIGGGSPDVEVASNPRSHSGSPASAAPSNASSSRRRKGKAYRLGDRPHHNQSAMDSDEDERQISNPTSPHDDQHPQQQFDAAAGNRGQPVLTPRMPSLMPIPTNGNGKSKDETEMSRLTAESGGMHCKFCGIAFQNRLMYRVHMDHHSFEDPFRCRLCGDQSGDAVNFFLHLIRKEHH